jgi:hypothetical protein
MSADDRPSNQQLGTWNFEYWNSLSDGQRIKLACDMQAEIARLTEWQAEWMVKYGVLNVQHERLRAALGNIADGIDRGYCCHVETDAPHDLRACLRRIAKYARESITEAAPPAETKAHL